MAIGDDAVAGRLLVCDEMPAADTLRLDGHPDSVEVPRASRVVGKAGSLLLGVIGFSLATSTFSWFTARLLLGPPLRPGPTSTYQWYLVSTLCFWAGWGVLAPLVLRVADRYRFMLGQRRVAAVAHVVAGFAIVCVQSLLSHAARLAIAPTFGVAIASPYRFITAGVLQNLDWNY